MDTEEWRWGYTSPAGTLYEVSSLGRCRKRLKQRGEWRSANGYEHKTKKSPEPYIAINGRVKGKRWRKFIHRLVARAFLPNWLKLPYVDHRNGDSLDNRAVNLRWRTHKQNCQNVVGKGASFRKDLQKWQSYICVNRTQIHLGFYLTEQAARAAYLAAKQIHHPECLARLPE